MPDTFNGDATSLQSATEPFLVFDGRDERPHSNVREAIFKLLQDISTLSTADRIHLLLTSRNESDIAHQFTHAAGWIRCQMHNDGIQSDIALYAATQIARHPELNTLPDNIKEEVQTKLVEGSNGMQVLL
ncbi:hypothetical protein BCR34DRAFT_594140 [Clohesyomyces aquaticus]|uniref:NACHT domain-containing protein n=1 Tax=Clohesyomyces aquaticus TaxID=1231657 RepID=A0A1Y1YCX5_9PLEO|nr:hypothetical protein BCR34DRAFT_594140 [Clohesyomyces aquaticus]